jgi:outer membrane protein TolC
MQTIKKLLFILVLYPVFTYGQDTSVLRLDTILKRIDEQNEQLKSYSLKAEGFQYSAKAATSWMAPMVGVGTFMTPYPGQEIMSDSDKGSLMLQFEQDIPNPSKLRGKRDFIASQGRSELESRKVKLNELYAQAKMLYYSWLIAEKRINILRENVVLIKTMKEIEGIRYEYNRSSLGSVFKADARIEDTENMIRMQEGEIAKARAWLNSLMNQPGNTLFAVDTTFFPVFTPQASLDTSILATRRKDITKMDADIESMRLNIQSMKKESKPDFKIRFDHMSPLGKMMPNAYSIMGMVSIPIAPWSSKMYKNEVKAMELNVQAMQKERTGMLVESQGMLYGMQYEIQNMQKQISAIEEKVIPSLNRALDANFQAYQENKQEITVVINDWEAVTMMRNSLLDEKLKLYKMIVDYEKELYK